MSKLKEAMCDGCIEEIPHFEHECPLKAARYLRDSIKAALKPKTVSTLTVRSSYEAR